MLHDYLRGNSQITTKYIKFALLLTGYTPYATGKNNTKI